MGMTPEQAQAVSLRGQGLSNAEIGADMGITKEAARCLIKRARKWMGLPPGVAAALEATGTCPDTGRHGYRRVQEDDGSFNTIFFKLPEQDVLEIEARVDEAVSRLAERSPVVVAPPRKVSETLLVLTPADIHMGKLCEVLETGDPYDMQVAEQRTKEGVLGLLEAAKHYGLSDITVNTGNDSLHIDTPRRTTTSGTPQDTDGTIFSMWNAMFLTWVWVIETAAEYAPVHVVFDPSNHPWVSDWTLNRALAAHFRNDARVAFDINMNSIRHRKYQVFGDSLIGFTHGDGAKEKDLPQIMQHECRKWWGLTRRGYWIVKHRHHKQDSLHGLAPYQAEKDHAGLTVIRTGDRAPDRNVAVEIVRSPSGTDGWHDRNGYVGAIKAVEAFLFHETRGQVARFTWPFY